jgi:hypothetical protein
MPGNLVDTAVQKHPQLTDENCIFEGVKKTSIEFRTVYRKAPDQR